MLFELISVIAAGFCAAGVVMILRHLSGARLARWLIPAAAGAGMLGMAIWNEQTWGSRTAQALPEGLTVVREVRETKWWQPWTLVTPRVTRLMALDGGAVVSNEAQPDWRLVTLYAYARWQPVQPVRVVVDCAKGAQALADPETLAPAAQWAPLAQDDPMLRGACDA